MIRLDIFIIASLVGPGSRVLDLGCGEGELLALLKERNGCRGTGIEINPRAVVRCLERGVSVVQGNIEEGLDVYADGRFDYVILNESLQQVLDIERVIAEALRVGKRVIVGVPNFGSLGARLQLLFQGRVPVTDSLPYKWYNTPNLRFLTLRDFCDFCFDKKMTVLETRYLSGGKETHFCPNLFADAGIFVLTRRMERP